MKKLSDFLGTDGSDLLKELYQKPISETKEYIKAYEKLPKRVYYKMPEDLKKRIEKAGYTVIFEYDNTFRQDHFYIFSKQNFMNIFDDNKTPEKFLQEIELRYKLFDINRKVYEILDEYECQIERGNDIEYDVLNVYKSVKYMEKCYKELYKIVKKYYEEDKK